MNSSLAEFKSNTGMSLCGNVFVLQRIINIIKKGANTIMEEILPKVVDEQEKVSVSFWYS